MNNTIKPDVKKIVGSELVEKIKMQIIRTHVTQQDLLYCIDTLKYLKRFAGKLDETIRESLCVNIVISYTRCFNSKFSYKLDAEIFDNTPLHPHSPADIYTEREFHELVMNFRNMHIVHSDEFLKSVDMGGFLFKNQYGTAVAYIPKVYAGDDIFYLQIGNLVSKAREKVSARLIKLQNKLIDLLKNGEAKLTDEKVVVKPIPDDISLKDFWKTRS